MIKYFTIYGERCSGTNYLENLITMNFSIDITWKYGFKHFFGFNDLTDSDETLFIGITRNPYDWFNSLYRDKHHLHLSLRNNIYDFLNKPVRSIDYTTGRDIMEERHIYILIIYIKIYLNYVIQRFSSY